MTQDLRTDVLHYGDNLDILRRYLPEASVDLTLLLRPANQEAERSPTRRAAEQQEMFGGSESN